jgi:exopolysaccharide biosynthesis protein
MDIRSTLAFLALATTALASACATTPPALPDDQPTGITITRIERTEPVRQVWHVARLDLNLVRLAVSPGDPGSGSEYRARTTSAALQTAGGLLAVNGGFYAVPEVAGVARGSVLDVVGTSISEGLVFSNAQQGSRAVNGIVCIGARVTIASGQTCENGTPHALAAGPLLRADGAPGDLSGQTASFGEARHPRTLIGLSADAATAWLVVVDGRQAASAGATLNEAHAMLEALGAFHILNLDGGGSSAMVRRGPGGPEIVSVPIDGGIPGRERAVANHLLVLAKD